MILERSSYKEKTRNREYSSCMRMDRRKRYKECRKEKANKGKSEMESRMGRRKRRVGSKAARSKDTREIAYIQ